MMSPYLPPADLVLDLNEVAIQNTPSRLHELTVTAHLGAPGIVESLQTSGMMVLSSSESSATIKISGTGIRPDTLQPHLRRLGLESLYKGGAFSCDVNAMFAQQDGRPFNASASITNISLQDTEELFGLKTIGVQGVRIDPNSGTTYINQVEVSGQRLALGRDETGCLTALGFRLIGSPSQPEGQQAGMSAQPIQPEAGGMDADRSATGAASADRTTARIEIGRLSWHDNELTFVDRMVTPANTIAVPDLGFELTNLVLGAEDGSALPASVKGWLSSPGTIERAELSGSMALEQAGLFFDLGLNGEGIALTMLAPYLQALGVRSAMTSGSVDARMNGHVTWADRAIRCSATIRDVAIKDGDVELAGLNQIDVEQLDLTDTDFRIERITLQQPRLALSRDESGTFSCVGLCIVPGREAKSETSPKPAPTVRMGHLEVKDARIQWSDRAVVPAVSQTLTADFTLSDFSFGLEAPPATVVVTIVAPGIVQQATISGQIQVTPSRQATDLKFDVAGVNTEPLLSYMPKGLKPALEEGRLLGRIIADLSRHPDGGYHTRVNLADVDYRGNSGQEPLLRFDSAELTVDRFDPNAYLVSIQELSLKGIEATVERKKSGTMSLLGFDLGTSQPAVTSNLSPSDRLPESVGFVTDEQPMTGSTPSDEKPAHTSSVGQRMQRLPLILLERLSVQARRLTIRDGAREMATPIVVSDLQIENSEGIRILGDEAAANPPVKIDIHGQIQPLTEALRLKLQMSPFAAQPQILAEWDLTQIHGPGLTSVVPELQSAVDANSLRNGRLAGTAQVTLHLDQRNIAEFDFSRPFGLDIMLKATTFSNTETGTVLAGFEEFRAAIPRLDPQSGSVHVKEIGLVKPQGAISREIDGLHLLGMTLKTAVADANVDGNGVAASPPTDPNDALALRVHESQEQDKQVDLRIDQFLINGIDFSFVDNTVDPPMYMPLNGLDVEVRGFATPGAGAKNPIRFNVVASAGEVPLPGVKGGSASVAGKSDESSAPGMPAPATTVNRLLFQEMSATGRLSLYPRPDGWVKAGLSGLELANFKGVAKQKGMTLRDGIFDASVDMRFHKDQPLSTRTKLVFTDLSLTEPPDGFLAKLLTLPVSLDTVLFILCDADGAIRLPLSFKIDEDGISRGQIAQAAVGAAATLITNAVAGSPYRVAGTISNILGGEEKATSGAEIHVVQYAPAVTTLSEKQVGELASIRERLRRERDLSVTVRHQLGGGDIEKANSLVNLSPTETRELLAKLRQERAELQRMRDELAGQTRAACAAGSRENVMTTTKRLQETETQLGLIERALDDLLETMRPGSEYAARSRTQNACIAIGKARIETLAALLEIEEIPIESGRITFVPPRFTEASDSVKGSITLTLSKSKAR